MLKTTEKIIAYRVDKMIDLEKLYVEDNDLYHGLCEKYPTKPGIYWYETNGRKSKSNAIEPIQAQEMAQEEPKVEEPSVIPPSEEKPLKELNEAPINDFPEDFKPLYALGEKIKIAYEYGRVVENITITNIKLENIGGKNKYYYTYSVDETGEVKTMGEEWLTEHEDLKAN